MKDIKIFACNSAEDFTQETCDTLGLPMGKKNHLNLQMITILFSF